MCLQDGTRSERSGKRQECLTFCPAKQGYQRRQRNPHRFVGANPGNDRPFDNKRWMVDRLRTLFRDPFFLLILAAGLLAFVVQSGELGTSDTGHRLQAAHALWTSEPPVFPQEYPDFGVRGRGGRIQSWYGIGQSLLMLPADVAGTWVASWPAFRWYGDDPTVRDILVSYSPNIL